MYGVRGTGRHAGLLQTIRGRSRAHPSSLRTGDRTTHGRWASKNIAPYSAGRPRFASERVKQQYLGMCCTSLVLVSGSPDLRDGTGLRREYYGAHRCGINDSRRAGVLPPTSTIWFLCTDLSPDRLDGYLAQRMGLCTTPNIVSSTRVGFFQQLALVSTPRSRSYSERACVRAGSPFPSP